MKNARAIHEAYMFRVKAFLMKEAEQDGTFNLNKILIGSYKLSYEGGTVENKNLLFLNLNVTVAKLKFS